MNSFAYKLVLIYDIFERENKLEEILFKAFPTMLTSQILDSYYSKISIPKDVIFPKVCDLIQIDFEGVKYKRNILSRWKITSLNSIIVKNETKLVEEYLQLMINNLYHLQYRLSAKLCNISLQISNLLMSVKVSLLAYMHISNLWRIQLAGLMIYTF